MLAARANRLTLAILLATFALVVADRSGLFPVLRPVTSALYSWAIILAAFALLAGLLNVLLVHARRIQAGQPGWADSVALIVSLAAVLVAGLVNRGGADGPLVQWVFDNIIAPGYAALFALLAFFMAGAAFILLRVRRTGGGWMVAGVLIMLFAQLPATRPALPAAFDAAAGWMLAVPVTGTLRGVLLGGALALLVLGARLLAGRER
jgi:hypothetical protein